MTTATIPLTTISVQNPKSTTRYGSLPAIPVSGTTAQMLARASLAGIPSGATVTSAVLNLWSYKAGTGSVTMTAKANTGAWSTASTWATKPATTTTNQGSQTRSAPTAVSLWAIDITALVQTWVSGSVVNNGVAISTASTTSGDLRGHAAVTKPPSLVVTYSLTAEAPTALNPTGGAVSIAKPTLTFQVPSDTASVQVQIDPAANTVTPGFDSGEIVSSAGLVDLTTTAYAGLSSGSSTQYRARVKNALGWGPWSGWVTFSRTSWGTPAITSPSSGTIEDPSPVVQATYSGTLTAWRVRTQTAAGAPLEDSGWTPGTTISYGTTKTLTTGATIYVDMRDNVTRVATPGDPDYLTTSLVVTVTPSGTPTVLASPAATQDGTRPWVTLTATRASVPDEVAIYRDGTLVARVPGGSVFSGTNMTYVDHTVPMNVSTSYTMRAVVNGAFSNATSAVVLTPTCQGVWLYDPTNSQEVALWGADDQEQDQPEIAIEHAPISGAASVIRRRLARYPRQGSLDLDLLDVLNVSAATSEANLRAWTDFDAGHVYQLVLGNQNDPVILGNIVLSEVAVNRKGERVLGVTMDWWWQG